MFTLIAIQFLQEYREHKQINFSQFKKYTRTFWVMNILYVLIGAISATVMGLLLQPTQPLAAIIYASSWEGIFGSYITSKKEGNV